MGQEGRLQGFLEVEEGLFYTNLAAHGAKHLSQKLGDPTLLEREVPLSIKHPQDDIPQPRLRAR